MRLRSVLAWIFVLALAAGAYFWSTHQAAKEEAQRLEDTRVMRLADPLNVSVVELSGEDYPQPVRIERRDAEHRWDMVQPVMWTADSVLVGKLLGTALDARYKDSLPAPKNPADFGLKPPRIKLTLTDRKAKQDTLLVGDLNPAGDMAYCAPGDLKQVWLIPAQARRNLALTLFDLRDKAALDFVAADVSRLEVALNGERLILQRELRDGEAPAWRFNDGKPASADAVEDLLYQIHGMRVQDFVDTGIKPGEMGLEPPQGQILLTMRGATMKGLTLGRPVTGEAKRYARRLSEGSVLVLDQASLDRLTLDRHALAERGVWKLDRGQVVGLIARRGQEKVRYAKEAGEWKRLEPPGQKDAGAPASLAVFDLAQLKYESILPAKGDYGLEPPALELELTVEKKDQPGQVELMTLELGRELEEGKLVAARVKGQDQVMALDATLLKDARLLFPAEKPAQGS